MHMNPDHALFAEAARGHAGPRLLLFLAALLANAGGTSPWWIFAVWVIGLTMWGIDRVRGQRLRILGVAVVVVGSFAGAGGWLTRDPLTLVIAALRICCGLTWVLWFASIISWPALKRMLRQWRCPELALELIDLSVAHGLILFGELRQRWEAAVLRSGLAPGQPQLECYGMVLAGGVTRAFDRATLLDEARTLRSARLLPLTDPEIAPVLMQEVTIKYPDGTIGIQGVSLVLKAGEWAAVIGPSGSGKSTLLRALAGLLSPSQGILVRLGVRLLPGPLNERVDRRVGLVFQNPDEQLFGSTPLEDLMWGLQRLGVASAEAEHRAARVLKELDIAQLGHRPVHRLSFGERKRVAFAAALVCEPELLLCDEPTSNLDPVAARRLVAALEEAAARRDITLVWVTHDLATLPQRIRRVLLLHDGHLVFDGERLEALSDVRLAQAGLLVRAVDGSGDVPAASILTGGKLQ